MIFDELWMQRVLQLAALGLGKVQPNPLVGAVVVHNEHIIGEGFHKQYGAHHAEVDAIKAVENQELLKKSTLYVNLEPCSHFGRTPPCASLVIEKKIPKVVVGMKDPNQNVIGKGIKMLKEAGVEVVENVLQDDCLRVNKRFVTYHTKNRPYIFLKWAQTKNGYMDVIRNNDNEKFYCDYWITNDALRVWTHKLRNEEQAFLIGYNTFKNDRPKLNNRLYGSNQPLSFVLCDENKSVITDTPFTFLYGNVEEVITKLHALKIQSVVVEGGKKTIQKFIDANLWDEAFVLRGSTEWVAGVEVPKLPEKPDFTINVEGEILEHYKCEC